MRRDFTFGIALIPRESALNWPLIEGLLELTLASIRAQTDPDWRVLIAGHDRPRAADNDRRVAFVEVDWPVQDPGPHNADSGRKKHLLNEIVLAEGGGLFMLLDADDWIDRRVVASARATIGPGHVGAIVDTGLVTDLRTLRSAAIPHPRVFDQEFHRICGSSTVAQLRPGEPHLIHRDPFNALRSHHQWSEAAAAHGAKLARLPVWGNYIINTGENHSERHGCYADWRGKLTVRVNQEGRAMDDAVAGRFGLSLRQIRHISERFFPREVIPVKAAAE